MFTRSVLLIAACISVLVMAACGSDDDGSSTSGTQTAGGGAVSEAAAAGAKSAGTPVKLPPGKVGYLAYVNANETSQIIGENIKAAAEGIGWDFVLCDGQGDPRKIAACGLSLINQGATAVMANAVEPSMVKEGLKLAQEKNVPWLAVGGAAANDEGLSANYGANGTEMTGLLSKWLIDQAGDENLTLGLVGVAPYVPACAELNDALTKDIEGSNVELVASAEVDFTDAATSLRQNVSKVLAKAPDVGSIVQLCGDLPITSSALATVGNKTPTDRPLLAGYYATPSGMNLIRTNRADAIAGWSFDSAAWVDMDLVAQYLARDTPFPPSDDAPDLYPIKLVGPTLVTKDNLPPEGEQPQAPGDYEAFFKAKWAKEFGVK